MRTATLLSFVMMIAAPAFADGEGLVAPSNPLGGPRWQARVEVNSTPLAIGGNTNATFGPAGGIQTTRLLGEYRLDALRFGQTSGLKLTSGLILSQRPLFAGTDARSTWPYLGLGYSGTAAHGDFSFSADVGLAAQSLGATVRLGRVLNGGLAVDDAVRGMQLQPMVRLGVNYSF